jgi:hypothetical protein
MPAKGTKNREPQIDLISFPLFSRDFVYFAGLEHGNRRSLARTGEN